MSEGEKINTKGIKDLKIKVGLSLVSLVLWVVYGILKSKSLESSKILMVIAIISTAISLFFIFGKSIANLMKSDENNSNKIEAITEEEVDKIIDKEINKLCAYRKYDKPVRKYTKNVNGNIIYVRGIQLSGKRDVGEFTDKIIVIVNATYPKISPTILPYSKNNEEDLMNAINDISGNPRIPITKETTELTTDPFGRPMQKTERTSFENESNDKSSEGLV